MSKSQQQTPQFDGFTTRSEERKRSINLCFLIVSFLFTSVALFVLIILVSSILFGGLPYISGSFLSDSPNSDPAKSGIGPALSGTIWVGITCALCSLPIGIGTAIMLEEFKPTNPVLKRFHSIVQINITNLAGVPSIVYGILGYTAFVSMFGLFGSFKEPNFEFGAKYFDQFANQQDQVVRVYVEGRKSAPTELKEGSRVETKDGEVLEAHIIGIVDDFPEDPELARRTFYETSRDSGVAVADKGDRIPDESWYYFQLPFGRGVLAAALTLMLVILPVIIVASQEAFRAVPNSLREGALGLGSTQWQVVRRVTLPAAIPGIMTGSILAFSRAIGEAAPMLMILGLVDISRGPQHLMDEFIVLPIQLYYWAGQPVSETDPGVNFQNITSAGIIVLLGILLSFNAIAIAIRQFSQQKND